MSNRKSQLLLKEGALHERTRRHRVAALDDRLELARAIKRNGSKPGIPWAQAKKELGLNDL